MKPGWKTSEFWATVIVNLVVILAKGFSDYEITPEAQMAIHTATVAAYSIGRGLAKSAQGAGGEGK